MGAQNRVIKVVAADGAPVAYATVSVEGGAAMVADANGEVSLGAGGRKTFTVNARRIGFTPYFGKLDVPDTAAVLKIVMPRLAQQLAAVTVSNENTADSPLAHTGFYDRWLQRQKGVLSAVFIGPEEMEFRHPGQVTNMLYGLNGVRLTRDCVGPKLRAEQCPTALVAYSTIRNCRMAIVIDGEQQHPLDANSGIDLNMVLPANDVAAIEIYARGGNMPVNFQFQDPGCGVLAFWTGSRR